MLQKIRQTSKGWVAWVIVGAISVPFALWGIENFNSSNSYGGQSGEEVLASVGDYDISYYDFYRELTSYNQRLRERYGENFDRIDQKNVRQNVLNSMFGRGVVFADALNKGMIVTDEQIKRHITQNPDFLDDNKQFDARKYLNFLSVNNLTAPVFEKSLRDSEIYTQYTEGFLDSNFLTQYELRELYQLMNHERKFAFALFPWDQKKDQVEVSEDEIRLSYEENRNRFAEPERVKVQYVSVSIEELADKVSYTDEQLEEFYENRKSDFTEQEERQVRHILLSPEDEKLAQEVREKLLSGGDFAVLAKEHSIDTLSAEKGGDLGLIRRGIMVEDFENMAFSLPTNEISEIVETEFGHHIIEVTEIKESKPPVFSENKEKVIEAYQLDQASERFFTIQEQLSNLAFDQPDSLQPIKQELGLEIQETEFFARSTGISSDTITQHQNFRNAAFSDQVKNEKLNSQVIDIQGQKVVVLHLLDVQAAYVKELEVVKDSIRDEIIRTRAASKLEKEIKADVQLLKSNELAWKDFIKKYAFDGHSQPSFEWFSVRAVDEDTPTELAEVYGKIFETARIRTKDGSDATGVYLSSITSLGNVAVAYIVNSRDVEITDEDIIKDSRIWTVMNNFQKSNMRLSMLEVLQARYPIPRVDVGKIEFN
jgi:peptidyl-prolyl cis-trans isomerase D